MTAIFVALFYLSFAALIALALYYAVRKLARKDNDKFYSTVESHDFKPMQLNDAITWNVNYSGYIIKEDEEVYAKLVSSEFNKSGSLLRGFYSTAPKSGNPYFLVHQLEKGGKGESRSTYYRTIIGIDIPDTKLQVVINSKLCGEFDGGRVLSGFSSKHKFKLEGNFADFYDIYMPSSSQSETLSMLTPDSMWYILSELADYDLEINGSMLYIYAYSFLYEDKLLDIVNKIDKLLEETRLRQSDSRVHKVSNSLVARTAKDVDEPNRYLNRKSGFALLLMLVLIPIIVVAIKANWIAILVMSVSILSIFQSSLLESRTKRLRRKYKKLMKNHIQEVA